MSGPAPPSQPPSSSSPIPESTPDRQRSAKEHFLDRELAEVYLLIDYLSGRPDKSLRPSHEEQAQTLLFCTLNQDHGSPQAEVDPAGNRNAEAHADIERDLANPCRLLYRVMEIKFPIQASGTGSAGNAAFLLGCRDILNLRAAPATGATIAFTTLVSATPLSSRFHRRTRCECPESSENLATFARTAYPWLTCEARALAERIRCMRSWAVALLLFAVAVSAYTAWGKSLLDSMDAIRRDDAAVQKEVAAAGNCTTANASAVCLRTDDIKQRYSITTHHLATWEFPLRWVCPTPSFDPPPASGLDLAIQTSLGCLGSSEFHTVDIEQKRTVEWATAELAMVGNYLLPSLYGWLGSIAFVLRRHNDRLAASLLTDRDRSSNNIRLLLGALIGASIGLFYSQSAAAQTSGMLGQAVTLSTSAMAFLAGYGVEVVFRAMDSIMKQVFRVNTTDKPASSG